MLAGFRTSRNETVLHTDSSLLPRRLGARASWNYHLGAKPRAATLTYHMNRLQSLPTREDYCVTLNDTQSIDERQVLRDDDLLPSSLHVERGSSPGAVAGD